MVSERVYSPAEICELFNISKSTLYRWEEETWFPQVSRDLSGQRQYTSQHIKAVGWKQREKLGKRLGRAMERDDSTSVMEIHEAISLHKFFAGDMTGLYELAEYPRLPPQMICELLQVAMDRYDPGEDAFCEIIQVVWEQCRKLSQAKDAHE